MMPGELNILEGPQCTLGVGLPQGTEEGLGGKGECSMTASHRTGGKELGLSAPRDDLRAL